MGRAGGDRVHRRRRDRRDARSQRPAARPLARDDGRLGRARLRGGRARRPAREGPAQGAAAARASSSSSTSSAGRIVPDDEVKQEIATQQPYGEWFEREHVRLADLPPRDPRASRRPSRSVACQLAFGYTQEDMKVMLAPLAVNAEEAIGSMGNDTPLAVLSDRQPLLYSYFKQLFAQVTNPPIDSIREAVVMSVAVARRLGAEPARRDAGARAAARDRQPDPERRRAREPAPGRLRRLQGARRSTSPGPPRTVPPGSSPRSSGCAPTPTSALARGANILILSDRAVGAGRASDSVAARRRRGAPPSRARRDAAPGRARRRVGRAAERAERRGADRLRRRGGEPVSDARDDRPARRRGQNRALARRGRDARGEGGRQGPPEGDLEDGDLDDLVLLRRAGLRGGRPLDRA